MTVATLHAPPVRPTSTVRLTRRGRLVVFAAALSLVLGALLGLGLTLAGSEATGEAGSPAPTEVVTVSTGETLWGLAAELAEAGAGEGDVRTVMGDIEELNALASPMLLAGQELRVPVAE